MISFNRLEKVNIVKRIYDKITRGGRARLIGLFYLIKNKYLYKTKLAYNGSYKKFPYDIMQQLFLNPLSKYLS